MKNGLVNWAVLGLASFFAGSLLHASGALAQDATTGFRPPCEGSFETPNGTVSVSDFSFWVGEWQVFDVATESLRGFDEIKLDLQGCALVQHWRQLSDDFMVAGAPYRLEGRSLTSIRFDGKWQQNWVDNTGSNILLTGGLAPNGTMVLETDWQNAKDPTGAPVRFKRRWSWQPTEDGNVRNWGELLVEGRDPQKQFNIVYRKNKMGGPNSKFSDQQETQE